MAETKYQGRQDASDKLLADPEGNMIFALEIAGIEVGNFIECSGLKSSTEVFEIQEGGLNEYVHKLPGQTRWENIVLRHGLTGDITLQAWREQITQDEFHQGSDPKTSAIRSGAIVVKRLNGLEVRRYTFKRGWPVAWEGPAFNANGADLAVEMFEIAHHGISVTVTEYTS